MSDVQSSKHFEPFAKLPEALVPASLQTLSYTGRFVKFNGDCKTFDWSGFKRSVDALHGGSLTLHKYKRTTIIRTDATVDVMVDKIVKFLLEALGVVIDPLELASVIEATFLNLRDARERGWANFSKSHSAGNTSWEYRVLFSLPNPDLTDFFYSLVTTIQLEANILEEEAWWGLVGSSSKSFSATIDAMELIVREGFHQ